VRTDRYARPERLLDRAEIEALLAGPS
jgi:hypothetical protein